MATRAERLRAEQERSKPKRPPAPKPRPYDRDKTAELAAEVSGTVRGKAAGSGLRNLALAKKGTRTYALEDSNGATSRKSTRRSSRTHVKAATPLTSRQQMRTSAPSARHTKGK